MASVRLEVSSSGMPLSLSMLWGDLGIPMLVITPGPEDARRLYEQLVTWGGREDLVFHFPETETLPFERQIPDLNTAQQRLSVLSSLTSNDSSAPMIVASTAALKQKTIGEGLFKSVSLTFRTNQRLDFDQTLALLIQMGYEFEPVVEVPGSASRRGGILDIFSVDSQSPVRIELWGDEIETIRMFDPITQRSIELVDSVDIIPAQETLPGLTVTENLERILASIDISYCNPMTRERLLEEFDLLKAGHHIEDLDFYSGIFNYGCVTDYFPQDSLMVMCRPYEIEEVALATDARVQELRLVKEQRGELPPVFPSSHFLWRDVLGKWGEFNLQMDVMPWGKGNTLRDEVHFLPFSPTLSHHGKLNSFIKEVDELASNGHRVVAETSMPKRLGEILKTNTVRPDLVHSLDKMPEVGSITVLQTDGWGISEGCVLTVDDRKLVVFSDAEIFGVTKQNRATRRRAIRKDSLLSDLTPGDYVVHVEHGVGRFMGTEYTDRDQEGKEHLVVEYAEGDKLYVPSDHLDRLIPYVASMGKAPNLTRLGTQEWRRTKERVIRSTREMAGELLSLYAARELVKGHSFEKDTIWQDELENGFPYRETPDQQTAIDDVKVDMERGRPMDRLVCGDVGYGKTEIALRSAFKAVLDGKQVAVLVPTTVLAKQHYETFSERLAAYPVTIDVLSRFRKHREQAKVIEGLANGSVDMCVGTHRLIQKDVKFKDLGLVIIDEEQRFGVAHKEMFKQMRRDVDVITMTATPIPRTLSLSLSGIRDMSTIETPPEERLPVKTYVSEFSDDLIHAAIRREIDRQGQVYFLHNRVYNIDYIADHLRRLVPDAEVGTAHGQMPEGHLEKAMDDFASGNVDVLVCTTIIESGLDIPNVNTLIVNRSDTFGLAQLYQLRGRVGRGSRRAYAYLLVPAYKALTEVAEKRLNTMLAATELGAGFQIAMRDLEIRGAGNVLGSAQSGHIHAVGFELYNRLLGEAVESLRAEKTVNTVGMSELDDDEHRSADQISENFPEDRSLIRVDLGIPANIPEDYVFDLSSRLAIYRRLAGLDISADVDSMESELLDRFGPLPWQVQNLLYVVRLKQLAGRAGIRSIINDRGNLVLQLQNEVGGAKDVLRKLMPGDVVVGHAQIRLDLDKFSGDWEKFLLIVIERLVEFKDQFLK